MSDVSLIRIEKEAMRPLIRMVYEGDEDMQTKFHILKGRSLDELVEYTYEQSTEESDNLDVRFYQVTKDGEPIGYTTLVFNEIGVFHTFGIDKKHRDEETKDKWLDAVKREFGDLFFVLTLREINKRAVKYFMRKGFDYEYKENEEDKESNFYILWQRQ